MISELLRSYLKYHAARERRWISRQRVYLRKNDLEIENVSFVPAVFIVVMVWAFCAVLLTLSASRQRDLSDWKEKQLAPFTVSAQADFKFINTTATKKARETARRSVPEIFSHNSVRLQALRKRLDEFFRQMEARYDAVREQRPWSPQMSLPSRLAGQASLPLLEALSKESLQSANYVAYTNALRQILGRGILQEKDSLPRNAGQLLRTVDSNQRYSLGVLRVREMPTPQGAAVFLAGTLLPQNPSAAKELAGLLNQLFGKEGTLDYNAEFTDALREKSVAAVPDVEQSCSKGDLLIRKGEAITPEILEMLIQEQNSLPHGFGVKVFYFRMAISFVLLLAALFFLYQLYPELFCDPQQFLLGGISVILALLANYGSIQFFSFLFREGIVTDYYLQIAAIPAMLGAVLVSAFLGNRAGIAVGFLTSSATAMMVMPESSFELALRWMAISMLGALFVRNVTNYRSYFLRVFFGSFLLTLAVTFDLIFLEHHSLDIVTQGVFLVLNNAFFCAVAALVLVFLFELLFNADSNMGLMVLCDYNHPLLERLKREAPGTMFHSMSVATLAEDAAREIGANPLKAKAGSLFHDIGKLVLPQYFVENNRDSSSEHLNLNPQMSSMIIRDHVKEGLILAKKYHLCRLVRGAIATHHGDDLVSYFYNRALAENKNREAGSPVTPVLESQFRYSGLPPTGKELTIISLADACEAACRSLNKPTPGKIQAMINDIFIKRLQGGQLRYSELTLAELDKVKECFINTLISIHHGRIAYQPEDMYESASKPLDAPAAAPAGK